jgi:hydroxyethylthiazole kinase
MLKTIEQYLLQIKTSKPLILNITNVVTMDFMANSLLAIGAAPLMSVMDAELEELITIADAVTINIGTLDDAFIKRAHLAATLTKKLHKPLILDPVGSGATSIRTQTARNLLPFASIVKGNASEIMSLLSDDSKTKGVEATHATIDAKVSAKHIALSHQCTVVVSGKQDLITDGKRCQTIPFGSALMPHVTGMGCTLTSVIAAFHAINPSAFESSYIATTYYGLCGQYAETQNPWPGSFKAAFIDALYEANVFGMMDKCSINHSEACYDV